jgi:hypothetical protein
VIFRALLLGCLLAALLATPAAAGPNQESMFQDDNELLYVPADQVSANLDTLRGLGVDRLRITVQWRELAPNGGSYTRPEDFDGADPGAYPQSAWDRYDHVVTEALARGIKLNLDLTGPSPLWANQPAPRPEIVDTFEPSPADFGAFATAVGRRYNGEFVRSDGVRLPRVGYWSIWNEPNHSGWLTPQWSADARDATPRAAALYRALAGAAWSGLQAAGHAGDTILVGETAPKGDRSRGIKRYMEALTFVRALYCVDTRGRRLRGARAGAIGCPASAAQFVTENPALFSATGYAHHPYELILAPTMRPLRPNWVTIANLSRLTRTLDRIFRRYGVNRRLPLYLTEYGYQTNPPDQVGVSLKRQAQYLNQSEYIAWRNRRVRTLSQFLLVDDDLAVPASFQSGLYLREGRAEKPALAAYRLPIWIPRPHVKRGHRVRIWGLLRPATAGQPAAASIDYRPAGSKTWTSLRTVTVTSRRHYVWTTANVPRSGHLRIASDGHTSRAAYVRVR